MGARLRCHLYQAELGLVLCETEARGELHAHSLEDSRGKVLLGLSVSLDGLMSITEGKELA